MNSNLVKSNKWCALLGLPATPATLARPPAALCAAFRAGSDCGQVAKSKNLYPNVLCTKGDPSTSLGMTCSLMTERHNENCCERTDTACLCHSSLQYSAPVNSADIDDTKLELGRQGRQLFHLSLGRGRSRYVGLGEGKLERCPLTLPSPEGEGINFRYP